MSWLDANEYFFMEAVARDRLDDIRRMMDIHRMMDIATTSDAADETPRVPARSVTERRARGMVESGSFHRTPAPLGTPGIAAS